MAGKRRKRSGWGSVEQKGKRFYAAYTGPDGKRHTPCGTSFLNESDARAWLHSEKRLIDLESWTPPAERKKQEQANSLTVGEWLEQYLQILTTGADRIRESTEQTYRRQITNRITSPISPGCYDLDVTGLKDIPVNKLSKSDVFRWWDGVQRCYPDSQSINQKAYVRLRAAMAAAVEREMITVNPVDVLAAKKKVKPKEKHLPTDGEIDLILEKVSPRLRVLTSLTLHHGLRVGEAIALEQKHVKVIPVDGQDLPRVVVTVEQNAQKIEKPHVHMVVQPPKSQAGSRDVPILQADVPYFLEHLDKFAPKTQTTVKTDKGQRKVKLLTASANNTILRDDKYRERFNAAKKAAGIDVKDFTPHCGRNWLITRLAEHGAHPKEIGKILGQEDMDTILKVYMKVRAGRADSLMDVVNNSLGGA